jgi:ABC-type spermidine/putrescine transport system permease subunit II
MKSWRTGDALLLAYVILFFCYLESPLAFIVLASFNSGLTVHFPPTGFSLEWYDPCIASAFRQRNSCASSFCFPCSSRRS